MKKLQKFFYDKESFLFSSLAIIGVILTMISSVAASCMAEEKLYQIKNKVSKELTTKEKLQEIIPIYIFPTSIMLATIGCILCSSSISKKHELAITNSYIILNETYKAYRQKVKELYGDEADSNIINELANNPKFIIKSESQNNIRFGDEENVLFFDEFSGRFFEAKPSTVLLAEYDLNRNYIYNGFININDFYSFLGVPPLPNNKYLPTELTNDICCIEFRHVEKEVSNDGLKCISISFVPESFSQK